MDSSGTQNRNPVLQMYTNIQIILARLCMIIRRNGIRALIIHDGARTMGMKYYVPDAEDH